MATISFPGIAAYQKQLEELGKRDADKMIRYAIYPAAEIVADEVKSNTPVDTGDLRDSMILTPMEDDGTGFISTQVKFTGYDSKGVPNQLKARALERGTSRVKARRFIKKAVAATKKRAEGLMQTFIDKYLYEKFGK